MLWFIFIERLLKKLFLAAEDEVFDPLPMFLPRRLSARFQLAITHYAG